MQVSAIKLSACSRVTGQPEVTGPEVRLWEVHRFTGSVPLNALGLTALARLTWEFKPSTAGALTIPPLGTRIEWQANKRRI